MTLARSRSRLLAVASLVALLWAPGCSGKGGPPSQVSSEFSAQDAVFFDDGVDFISSAVALDGHWREEWIGELHGRVDRADAIVGVRVDTVRTDISPQREKTYRLSVALGDVLKGSMPGEEATLTTTPASQGYRTVDSRTGNLEAGEFLLFAKWAELEDGREVLRWHLAPASEDIRAAVRKRLGKDGAGSGKTISVHPLEE